MVMWLVRLGCSTEKTVANKRTDNKQTLLLRTWRERGMGFSADGDISPSSAKAKCTEPGGGFVSGESRKEESRTVDPPPPRRYSLRDT